MPNGIFTTEELKKIFESKIEELGINKGCLAVSNTPIYQLEYCNEHINWLFHQFLRKYSLIGFDQWAEDVS